MAPNEKKSPGELKAFYAGEYVEQYARTHTPVRLENLLKRVQLNSRDAAVDLACGDGMLMPYVAPRVASYVGVDFSEEFINKARERKSALGLQNAELHCSDINTFCNKYPARFDCAFALDFSEHVYDEQWREYLAAVRQTLKPGGSLYLHTPNSLFLVEQMKRHAILLPQAPQHIAVRSVAENVALLRGAGFRIQEVSLLAHYNALRFIHFLSYAPFIGKYFGARVFVHATN